MGILELIKLRRVLITTITVTDDVVEYNEKGLEMMFKLNPDYIPPDSYESEFDAAAEETAPYGAGSASGSGKSGHDT